MFGHAAANPSYVTRPSKSASASNSSSYLNLSPSAARSKSNVHRGSSITPSSDTNSVTTILLIVLPSVGRQPDLVPVCHDLYERAIVKSTAPSTFLPEAPGVRPRGARGSSVRACGASASIDDPSAFWNGERSAYGAVPVRHSVHPVARVR